MPRNYQKKEKKQYLPDVEQSFYESSFLSALAGFLDADGSMQLLLTKRQKPAPVRVGSSRKISSNWVPYEPRIYISLSNSDKDTLETIKETLNGNNKDDTNAKSKRFCSYKHIFASEKSNEKGEILWHGRDNCLKLLALVGNRLRGPMLSQLPIFSAALKLNNCKQPEGIAQYIYLMYLLNSQGQNRSYNLQERLEQNYAVNEQFASQILFNENAFYDKNQYILNQSCFNSKLEQLFLEALKEKDRKEICPNYFGGYYQGDGSFYFFFRDKVHKVYPVIGFSLTDDFKPIIEQLFTFLSNEALSFDQQQEMPIFFEKGNLNVKNCCESLIQDSNSRAISIGKVADRNPGTSTENKLVTRYTVTNNAFASHVLIPLLDKSLLWGGYKKKYLLVKKASETWANKPPKYKEMLIHLYYCMIKYNL